MLTPTKYRWPTRGQLLIWATLGCATAFAAQPPSFSTAQTLDFANGPNVVITDVNGDGIPDLLGYDGSIKVQFGNGNGTFRTGPETDFPNVSEEGGYAVGDINGDGKVDVVALGYSAPDGPYGFQVMLANGDGTFRAAPFISVPSLPAATLNWLVVGEFNGDGKADLVFTWANLQEANDSGITLLPGNGDGTFGKPITTLSPSRLYFAFLASDLNGDGLADLVIPQNTDIMIWLSEGNGHFSLKSTIAAPNGAGGISAGDLNHDGKVDLVNPTTTGNWDIYLGNGDGTFQNPLPTPLASGASALGDVNGDGNLDIVSTAVQVAFGHGDGTFGKPSGKYPTPGASAILLGDLRNRGTLDIVAPSRVSTTILLNSGKGKYVDSLGYQVGNSPACIVTADFNNDGHPDVVYADATPAIRTLLGTGSALVPFRKGPAAHTSVEPCLAVGDFNGDGIPDVAAIEGGPTGGTVGIYLGAGDGSFTEQPQVPVTYAAGGCVGDFNGDGKLDLANGYGYVNFGNGDGTLGPQVFLSQSAAFQPEYCATADLNGDGLADIALTDPLNGTLFVFLGQSDGTFQEQQYAVPGAPTAVAIGDFNHDGLPDIAMAEVRGIQIYRGQPNGTFALGFSLLDDDPAFGNVYQMITADFNGDGNLDLALNNSYYGFAPLLTGNGDGTFQLSELLTVWVPLEQIVAVDLHGQTKGHGAPDIVQTGGNYIGYLINKTQ